MAKRDGTWPGGYLRRDARGRAIHIIRKKIGGVRYEVSTGATTLRAAMAQLERFESDPRAYATGGAGDEPIFLDAKLVGEYLAACNRNVESYLREKRGLLSWWGGRLRRVDLRRATLRGHILPALDGVPGRNKRIAVIKHLYAWLRTQDRIDTAEDPTFGKLRADPVTPAQEARSKVIDPAHYEAARRHMVGHYRDALDLLAGTGWHVTEVERFAVAGEMEDYAGSDPEGVAVLTVRHKSGRMHRTLVTQEVADAATRLRARGRLSRFQLSKVVRAACVAAGVPVFTPGRFRHSIATMAWSSGHAEAVPAFLGHRSKETTKKYYATRAIPPRVPTMK